MNNQNKVLVLRTVKANMSSYNGFVWPEKGHVKAPDWNTNPECGNGLHGWLWGVGDFANRIGDHNRKWLVVEVLESNIIQLENKVKFKEGDVIYCGHWHQAFDICRSKRPLDPNTTNISTGDYGHASSTGNYGHASSTGYNGHASSTGNYGHASSTGNYGHASSTGNYGHASSTGESGHASSTGNYGHASSTGNYGHASSTGYNGHASSTGESGHASSTGVSGHAYATGKDAIAATLGYKGVVMAGENGMINAVYHDGKRNRMLTGYVGENGILPNTKYTIKDGVFVKL